MTLNNIISLSIIFLFLRVVFFSVSFPKNFDNLWRPGTFDSLPIFFSWIQIIVVLMTIIYFIRKLKETDNITKNSFFIYFTISFISISLFNRTIENTNITYLLLLVCSNSPFSVILPNLILDCFYEPPYIVWSLLFMAFVYYVCKKYKKIEYSIPFWIIPFSMLKINNNDFTIISILVLSIVAFIGLKYSKNRSSFYILTLQFIFNTFSIIYIDEYSNCTHPNYLKLAMLTILIFYIPSFLLLIFLYKVNSYENNSIPLTWILPVTTIYFLYLPLCRLVTLNNLIYFISILNLFLFTGNIIFPVFLICLISFILKKLIKKQGQFTLFIGLVVAILYYISDATLFYYSQFRINYQTLFWTKTMNNIGKTTLTTCLKYFTPISAIIIILTLLFAFFIYFKRKQLINNSKLKFNFLIIIFISQVSVSLMALSNPLPQIVKDPLVEFVKSIPISNYMKKHLTINEIISGFNDCNVGLKKYSHKDTIINSKDKTNVILITLESVHWRYINMFGKEVKTWPLMSKLKDRMEIFPFVFSCFPESTCGDYSMVTSLVPYNMFFINQNPNLIHKGLVNELKKMKYNTCIFSSGSLYDGGLINVINMMPFDYKFYYSSSKNEKEENLWTWGYKEEYTSKKIIEYLNNRNIEYPYFVWYRTVYPHAPFDSLEPYEKLLFKEKDKYGRLNLLTKYKNALLYLDRVLYDFVNSISELDKKNNQKTLIVMVGDHGEMLEEKDNGGLTSHGLYTTAQLQNVVCIFIHPQCQGLKINKNIGSQIDITPTILDYLNIQPSIERYEQGDSLYSSNLASRTIYLSSVESYALIEDGYFFEFRDKSIPNVKITKLFFSNDNLKPIYKGVSTWNNHKDIYEKYQRVNKYYKIQEDFISQLNDL